MEQNNDVKKITIEECRAELVEMVNNLEDDEARYIHRLIALCFLKNKN